MYEIQLRETIENINKAMIKRGIVIAVLLILAAIAYAGTQESIADAAFYYMAGYQNVTYSDYSKITIGFILYAIYHAYKFFRTWLIKIKAVRELNDFLA